MAAKEQSHNDEMSRLDRVLSVVTEVRAGESGTALLMALNVLILLCAYYVIKPAREALIGDAEIASYASAGQVVVLSLVVPAYGLLVQRIKRSTLIPAITLFFIGCFVLFFFAAAAKISFVGIGFFLFVGVFNLMIVAQFWAFATDIYTKEQGERLFPVVAFGASSGAVIGSMLSSWIAKRVAVEQLLLVSAGMLGVTILITRLVERRAPRAEPEEHDEHVARAPEMEKDAAPGTNPFLLVARSRYLLLIAVLMFLANLVNTNGEFILRNIVGDWIQAELDAGSHLSEGQLKAVFWGEFYQWVNIASATIQLLVVSRVIKLFGVRIAIMVLPIVALGTYFAIALFPVLAVTRWVKTAENSTDYSLNNTVRNALFLPLSREEKYKAKQAIDTFFVRGGDVASAGVVALGLNVFGWSHPSFAWFNAVVVAIWLVIAVAVGRRYAQFSAAPSETE